MTGTTLVVFGLLQASALAGIYKWKDDQGKLHFTDSKSKVPMKYRNQLQKFKGVNETTIVTAPDAKKEGKQAAADSKTGDKSGEKPDKKTEPEKEKVAKKEGPDMDPNLMQALKKARDYLETENNALLQVFNRPFSERIAEKYIPTIEKLISQKEAAFGELEGYDQPSIRKARQFIGQSLVQDRELVEDPDTSSEFLRE
ncbi:MAG: DUF4124 domain-containing protein, partial [Nitrospinaceae bacterium]|nr:DUF4124 domain-containing protein [Nitrospinaceae bacterium]NIR57403.1 DUF4124 domain-containing protein [Nitrospinaceae bacterium]NIS87855.1 DUF4124 domain-containing protein [Nitrospinaceae bacterium]NIT84726.1 DUF4124 domain-containing protein [Nitrospinaceae bacterium]NIU99105.1 DUF4124 domain-containing protein [Nitrospinaceae bacterium]